MYIRVTSKKLESSKRRFLADVYIYTGFDQFIFPGIE